MLSSDELVDRLSEGTSLGDRLHIIPKPDLELIGEKPDTSVDLRLGRWFRSFRLSRQNYVNLGASARDEPQLSSRESFVRFGDTFTIHPGRFVLGVTLEWIKLPVTLAGHISGKSSLGRHGLIIETASAVQPGFNGCLTLEIANIGEVPLGISPGMPICQLFFFKTKRTSAKNVGKFSVNRKPTIRRPVPDSILLKLSRRLP